MTLTLGDTVAGSPTRMDGADPCSLTIASYNHSAAAYALRLSQADLEPYLTRFRNRVALDAAVLDGGCGSGRDVQWMIGHGLSAVGLDLSEGMLAQARLAAPTATFVHGDLRNIPMPDRCVDGVWLCASLLHLAPQDALVALREAHRVLVRGGSIFVSTAAGRGSQWRTTELGRRWFQLYEEAEVISLLTEAGFAVVEHATEPGVVAGQWVNVVAEKRN